MVTNASEERAKEIADRLSAVLKDARPLDVADEALDLARRGLALAEFRSNPGLWAEFQQRIGLLAVVAGNDRGDLPLLREGIAASAAALTVYGRDPASRDCFRAQRNRALGLVYLGQLADDPAPMGEAVDHLRDVLAALPRDAPEARWANCVSSLGAAWWSIGITGAQARATRRAIACFRLAERAFAAAGQPADVLRSTYNLGLSRATLGDLTGDPADYDRAIAILETIRARTSPEQDLREWATVCDAIALTRANRGEVTGDPDAIAAALAECEALLEALPRAQHPAWWAMVMVNLCEFTLRLASLRGDPSGLMAAAEATREAREVAGAQSLPAYWTALMQTAAKARLQLGMQTGDAAQVERAMALAGEALETGNGGPRERAALLVLRGRAARHLAGLRPEQAGGLIAHALGDFDAASASIERRAAPSLWVQIGLARAEACGLAGARTRDRALLAQAVDGFSAVLEAMPAAGTSPKRGEALAGRGRARLAALLAGAGDDPLAIAADFDAARRHLREELDPATSIEAGKGEASALLLAGRWEEAAAQAGGLIERATVLIAAEPAEHARLNLAEALAGLGDLAAYALLRLGRADEALARHEGGRAHRLRARLRLAEAMLDKRHAARMERLRRRADLARRALAQAIERDRPAAAVARLAAALTREHERFVSAMADAGVDARTDAPDVATLREAAGDGVVALPIVTPAGGALLLLGGAGRGMGVETIWLDGLTTRAVEDLLSPPAGDGWLSGYAAFRDALTRGASGAAAVAAFQETVAATLAACWALVMEALDRHLHRAGLGEGSEVALIPDGRLSALPLHAAGTRDGAFLDRWAVSYAPSLAALAACRRRAATRPAFAGRLLAVTDPELDLGRLVNPAEPAFEATLVRALHGPEASRAAVVEALPQAAYVSFFTHAVWNPEHPERSALRLAGGEALSAEDLASLDLGNCRMAVLGACESGVPGLGIAADEFRGMPSALLEAGIPGALATLWPVFTHSTDRIVADFFRHHLGRGLSPARALRLAQLAQRGEKGVLGVDAAAMGIRRGATTGGDGVATAGHDLSLPVFWAAFSYIGA